LKKEKELKACTFKPTLSKHLKKGVSPATTAKKVPIWERLNKETKNMDELERQAKEYQLKDCTFSPHLSKESTIMTQDTQANAVPIWERLYEEASDERKVSFLFFDSIYYCTVI
jgi:hypothetical protein